MCGLYLGCLPPSSCFPSLGLRFCICRRCVDPGGHHNNCPSPVRNLSVEVQATSSVILNPQTYTYWVHWASASISRGTRNMATKVVVIEGLESGTSYTFTVWAERNGVCSDRAFHSPTPDSVNITSCVSTSGGRGIILTLSSPTRGYKAFELEVGGQQGLQNRSSCGRGMSVLGLQQAQSYIATIKAVWDGMRAPPASVTCYIDSADLHISKWLKPFFLTCTVYFLLWIPEGLPSWLSALVKCLPVLDQWFRMGSLQGTQSTSDIRITVKELEAGTLYTFTVWVERNGISSNIETIHASTVPNRVTSLGMQDQTNSSITLSWTAPLGPDQPPYTYWVQWSREESVQGTQNISDTSITVKELEAGTLYTFTVWVERNNVNSTNKMINASTVPNEVTDLNTTQTNNSVTLRWKPPTDPYSHLYIYWIQWATGGQLHRGKDLQGDKINQTAKTNETQYTVKALSPGTLYNFSVWAEINNVFSFIHSLHASTAPDPVAITSCVSTSGGYGVILTWSCPPGGYEVFKLQVGRQDFQNTTLCESGVSLSGFQPAQSYLATVTTVWDGMRAPSASMTCYTESTGVIVGSIVGVLLFVFILGLLVFFLKKRNKKSPEKQAARDLAFSFPGDILAEDFADHVRKNEKDSNCGFAEEYQQLALEGHDQPHMVASAPENNAKNRYRNVLPYDWSRVPLKPLHGEPGSDYINASFIPGLWSPQEFIAAQGPLAQTVGDFWRLVWEQQSHTLVMLTNCVESGWVKCEHYWPLDSQPCTHGHIQVTLVDEEVTENWTTRDLKLFHVEEQKALSVRQFHYIAWPDHGVPHSPDPLLAFWKVLRKWLDQNMGGGPPIVHCSAGVGRTGTLIALDVLLQQLECEGLVGPFNFVRKMRGSRPLMVQTEAQYVFLHQCILRFLQQSHPAPEEEEVMYENVADLLCENVAAIQAHKCEV
ncbi:receptor-type tyrosine-protein phosphatase H [Trichechus manatus latirostris]|uniref:Receptor-type tyrosine-protein phosphatase H n=1 Tax=Trichechus manatus latirostris TaxID=127582 RepID=A0A2Y9DVR5_TRIMA|nr:receptor-type tyrosine-protein phosphatase H [Trichechus manatus latirostris]